MTSLKNQYKETIIPKLVKEFAYQNKHEIKTLT